VPSWRRSPDESDGDALDPRRGHLRVCVVRESPLAAPEGRPLRRTGSDHLFDRFVGTWRYAFKQEKMDYYQPAGIAHKLIFVGFLVLLLRS
jgi:hypothetical protein